MEGERAGINAVITGGGNGMGRQFGIALAREGAHVALIDTDADAVENAAAEIRAAGGLATAYPGDVTDEARMAAIMDDTAHKEDGIHILINNAGLHSGNWSKPIVEMGMDKTRKLFDVNINGVILCTLLARPHMANRKSASIVNIASMSAYLNAVSGAYGVAKLAVVGATIAFASELAPENIRVNAIAPGLIWTDAVRRQLSEAHQAQAKGMQLLNHFGEEQHIVDAMMFLTSEKAQFITGETLRVTGGAAAAI